jgi:hypothetical protein
MCNAVEVINCSKHNFPFDCFQLYMYSTILAATVLREFSCYLQADKRVADMKLAKDFGATMEEFRKLQNLAIQREMAYKPVDPQYAQSK